MKDGGDEAIFCVLDSLAIFVVNCWFGCFIRSEFVDTLFDYPRISKLGKVCELDLFVTNLFFFFFPSWMKINFITNDACKLVFIFQNNFRSLYQVFNCRNTRPDFIICCEGIFVPTSYFYFIMCINLEFPWFVIPFDIVSTWVYDFGLAAEVFMLHGNVWIHFHEV